MFALSASPYGETIYREFATREEADEFANEIRGLTGDYLTSWGYQPVNTEVTVWEEDALNDSAVTYVSDMESKGWAYVPESGTPRGGWEAISPTGEITAWDTFEEADAWRMREVRDWVESF